MKKSIVIVESPAKAKTLSRFLGTGYDVVSSMGHIIDLPASSMGIDVDDDFKPQYAVLSGRRKILTELKKKAKESSIVYLATDPDREGEAISWHLERELVNKKNEAKRVEFHEITKQAIEAAFEHPRQIDMDRVNAQQARRILDRIVGYNLSPLLWQKVGRGLSAGRVQSVALRLIVEREDSINAFKPQEYWEIEADLKKQGSDDAEKFSAKLIKIKGKAPKISSEDDAEKHLKLLKERDFIVTDIKDKKQIRKAPYPYTTSTLQQDAFNKLRFSSGRTMRVAQQLYEGLDIGKEETAGLITYMRTDSTQIAKEALSAARKLITSDFSDKYLAKHLYKPKKSKQKTQEAHEAIRPTSVFRRPEEIKKHLSSDQFKLYHLIWQRFIQSQMAPAVSKLKTVDITAAGEENDNTYIFRSTGSQLVFDGFLTLDDKKQKQNDHIPQLDIDEQLVLLGLNPSQHFTKPPARFSDASLVKELEDKGIGRPSTYAPTIATIVQRHYVTRKSGYFYPTEVGMVVTKLLIKHFPNILDVGFTALMEDELDKVEEGDMDWVSVLKDFYKPFTESLSKAQDNMEDLKKKKIKTEYKCELCGKPMIFKWSRRGTFLGCSGFPKCKNSKPARKTEDGKVELIKQETTDVICEKCGKPMIVKNYSRGRFLSCSGYPACKNTKAFPTGVKCPKEGCDGELVERYSRRGPFYGCSKYPDCTYTSRKLPKK
jgi:DNA topoisomerase-1